MPQIMSTKEISEYLRVHQITICKYAAQGVIPAVRVGRVWRFDKEAIDKWVSGGDKTPRKVKKLKPKAASKAVKVKLRKKRKS